MRAKTFNLFCLHRSQIINAKHSAEYKILQQKCFYFTFYFWIWTCFCCFTRNTDAEGVGPDLHVRAESKSGAIKQTPSVTSRHMSVMHWCVCVCVCAAGVFSHLKVWVVCVCKIWELMTFSWVCVKCPKPPLHQPPTRHTWDSLVSSATAL